MEVTQRQVGEQLIRQTAWHDPFEHCGPDRRMAAVCRARKTGSPSPIKEERLDLDSRSQRPPCHRWLVQQRSLFILFLAVRRVV
jgi:hypothetical protein